MSRDMEIKAQVNKSQDRGCSMVQESSKPSCYGWRTNSLFPKTVDSCVQISADARNNATASIGDSKNHRRISAAKEQIWTGDRRHVSPFNTLHHQVGKEPYF